MSKRTLLLADDSVTIQKVVNLTFADEGIDVITVGDGDSAMEKIAEMSPDVVLADVHMPGLSGYQICEILRENPATRHTPVILLVGSFEPFDESEAARVGANAYLTKPFQSIRQLVSQVTDLMDASPSTSPEPVIAQTEPAEDEMPETQDIDSLYNQSFTEQSASGGEGEAGAAPRYVDAGMDDEMIETSFADLMDDTAPASASELSTDGEAGFRAFEARAHVPETFPAPETGEDVAAFETLADDSGGIVIAAIGEDDASSEFDEFSRTTPALQLTPSSGNEYGMDEVELLELPPIENGKTLEFTTTQRSFAEGGTKQVVSLSPELIDMIVQKVVEKLSEKY
ncbi:MAG: response regulator [Acidobacteriota bacterium]